MKLKLDFVIKVPKLAKDNQVILIKDKRTKIKIVFALWGDLYYGNL